MRRFGLALAVLFAAFTAQAQTTPPAGAAERKSSSREEQRQKMRAARQKAVETCKSAQPDKHRDCMRHEMCAQAKDPVQCEARARQRAERRKPPKPSG
jgi:uncharacterized membrane protein